MKTWVKTMVQFGGLFSLLSCNQPIDVVTIDLSKEEAEIPSSLYGIFFEEITHSGDGGLYAEMIRNRGFEDGTLPSGTVLKDGKAIGPFGVMGGFMQPQGHVQVIMNTLDFMMNPQETLDAPRWQWVGGKKIQVERTFPADLVEELRRRGHEMEVLESSLTFGRGQIIWRNENGVLCGATEPRADGTVAVW
mgnify:CR=1 FL=1